MASFCQVSWGQAGCCQIHNRLFMILPIHPVSVIAPLTVSQVVSRHEKGAPHAMERPFQSCQASVSQ